MPLRYRKSNKLSLSVSLFWIVGFLALLICGPGALLDGQPLLADEKVNMLLELPKGNGPPVNKTLLFSGDAKEIVFTVHRPASSCLPKDHSVNKNTVELWLGDESCKMNLMWSDDGFRLETSNQKSGLMPTESKVNVTLKNGASATVKYRGAGSPMTVRPLCSFALKDIEGVKVVQFGMKGNTNCGMTLEFDKNVQEYDAKKNSNVTTKKPVLNRKKDEESTLLGMSTGLGIAVIVLIVAFVLLAGIAVGVYFCCFKGRRSKKVNCEAQYQPEQGATHKSIASEAWKMDDSTTKASCTSCITPIRKESKSSSSSSDNKKKRKKAEGSKSKATKKGKKMQKKRSK